MANRSWGSVRVRVTGFAMLVVLFSLTAGSVALLALLSRSTIQSIRTDTQVRAAELSVMAQRGELTRPLPPSGGDRQTLLQVIERNGSVSTASTELADQPELLTREQRDGDSGRRLQLNTTTAYSPSPWWVEAVPVTLAGRRATVIVATSLAEWTNTLRQLSALLALGIPILTLAAGLLVWFLVGRALRPVERLRFEVATLASNTNERTKRVAIPRADDEISHLAGTLNELLDELEQVALAQQRFVADASHELRGPVANIRLAIEVARAHPAQADWETIADEVLEQDLRMGRLVEDLLILARNEGDRSLKSATTIDLANIVASSAGGRAGGAVGNAGGQVVTVRVIHCEEVLLVDDPTHLTSIVTNLIDNAVRFAASEVTVALVATTGWAELVVRDDGPGVPLADRPRIFDRFYRVDAHRSRQGGGSGLGLAIVHRLVTERGGTVTVADAHPTHEPPGAAFTVRLPLSRPLEANPARPRRTQTSLSNSLGTDS